MANQIHEMLERIEIIAENLKDLSGFIETYDIKGIKFADIACKRLYAAEQDLYDAMDKARKVNEAARKLEDIKSKVRDLANFMDENWIGDIDLVNEVYEALLNLGCNISKEAEK